MSQDPFYTSAPARFVAEAVSAYSDHAVVVDPELGELDLKIDHDDRIILVRPGLTLPKFQLATGRAVIRIRYPEHAPEFGRPRPKLAAVPVPRHTGPHEVVSCPICFHHLGVM